MDHRQFSRRIRELERKLYRISRTVLSDDDDCQDALQETLIKAWMNRSALRDDTAFEPWIIRILINECRQLWRRTRRHRHGELGDWIKAPPAKDLELRDALFKLPEKHRLPLVLHYLDGYSVKEIAAMLRAPEGTVKSWLHTGREKLKTELNEEDML